MCCHYEESPTGWNYHGQQAFTKNLVELSFLHSWICLGAQQGTQLEIASIKITRSLINNAPQIELGVGRGAPE